MTDETPKGEPCEKCGKFVEGFEYMGCCSGHQCGCMGKPLEPCLCEDCWNIVMPPPEPQHCPNCPDQGWYAVWNEYNGNPEQEQCEFCETVENSVFNLNKIKA